MWILSVEGTTNILFTYLFIFFLLSLLLLMFFFLLMTGGFSEVLLRISARLRSGAFNFSDHALLPRTPSATVMIFVLTFHASFVLTYRATSVLKCHLLLLSNSIYFYSYIPYYLRFYIPCYFS